MAADFPIPAVLGPSRSPSRVTLWSRGSKGVPAIQEVCTGPSPTRGTVLIRFAGARTRRCISVEVRMAMYSLAVKRIGAKIDVWYTWSPSSRPKWTTSFGVKNVTLTRYLVS